MPPGIRCHPHGVRSYLNRSVLLVAAGVAIGAALFGGAWALAAGGTSVGAGTLVTSLPACTAGNDGQVVFLQSTAMANVGSTWRMRCRSGSASAYKWEFAGGAPMSAETGGSWGSPAVGPTTTYVNVGLAGTPSLTLPAAGEYLAYATAAINASNTSASCGFFLSFNGAQASGWDASDAIGGPGIQAQGMRRGTLTAAGQIITFNWINANIGGNCRFYNVRLQVTPIRLA